ncbi:class I SAM-dependent methyltransferase [Thalassobacillus pellis]|uniref:class I SAM-dependent methyltransferase n=1 Tax=Thalassobacillus pellis TaxID=748008 RepID=UPI001960D0F2|nr:class I SAM-dependent methyltransferase [Thalassobacillus pellis]MBM7553819.1 putative AdoMet-dependent methyltransferase [Thalassobacillus pellis]
MGVEFVDLFDKWASSYDDTVSGVDPEYKEVFEGYDNMLAEVASLAVSPVLEFGIGTANLTQKIVAEGKMAVGIEPSREMRKIATVKCPEAAIYEGDFMQYPNLLPFNSIISSFAFHHLTDTEKNKAIAGYSAMLKPGGTVLFLDTLFASKEEKSKIINEAKEKGFMNLYKDLNEEYYPFQDDLRYMFEQNNFDVTFKRKNKFAWLIQATKKENG